MAFKAAFKGICDGCHFDIEIGEDILYNEDGDLCHDGCEKATVARGEVCDTCFVEKSLSGSCQCEEG